MGNEIVFSTIKSNADNRVLEQDDKGYYKIIIGGLNARNFSGDFYSDDGVRDLIESKSSTLNRRLKGGYLKSEVGHPQFIPGMTKTDFYIRNMKIDVTNTCAHIRDIILTPTGEKSDVPGQGEYILIEAWIKPSGVKGDALKAALDNPEENVAFSIRCFTNDTIVGGVNIKKIIQIITFDWVLEPGINKANKWSKLGIESRELCRIDVDDIANGSEIDQCFNCSLESADERDMVKEVITNMDKMQAISGFINNW